MENKPKKRALIADLPNGIGIFHQVAGSGKEGYAVRIGKKFSGVAPCRKFFSDLDGARKYIDGLKPHSETMKGAQLSQQTISEAILCVRLLEEKKSGLSLVEAVKLALEYHDPSGGRKTISEVADELYSLVDRSGAKKTSLAQMKSLLKGIKEEFGTRLIGTLKTQDIQEWAEEEEEWGLRTKRNYLKMMEQLFSHAVKKQYAGRNPCDAIVMPKVAENSREVLSVEGTRKLLEKARESAPELIVHIASLAFGWLRRSEIVQLQNIHFRKDRIIVVPIEVAKTLQHRHIPINDTLKAWLDIAPKSDRPTPSADKDVMGKKVRELAEKAEVVIPPNGLRHSSISYALAYKPTLMGKGMDNGIGAVAKYAGNSEGVIAMNYRKVVEATVAKKYWEILPS